MDHATFRSKHDNLWTPDRRHMRHCYGVSALPTCLLRFLLIQQHSTVKLPRRQPTRRNRSKVPRSDPDISKCGRNSILRMQYKDTKLVFPSACCPLEPSGTATPAIWPNCARASPDHFPGNLFCRYWKRDFQAKYKNLCWTSSLY